MSCLQIFPLRRYIFGEKVSYPMMGSLGQADDMDGKSSRKVEGYFWMVANCAVTATYVLYLRAAVEFRSMTR